MLHETNIYIKVSVVYLTIRNFLCNFYTCEIILKKYFSKVNYDCTFNSCRIMLLRCDQFYIKL